MMQTPQAELPFDGWIKLIFDRPVSKSSWIDAEIPNTVACAYLNRLFDDAGALLRPYSDPQVNQGFWFIVGCGASDYLFALCDPAIPWEARRRCVRSMRWVFEQCFAQRCSPHLSHLDEPGAAPLNSICYMWWDIAPNFDMPDDSDTARLHAEIFGVMEHSLGLASDACRESALHGLGHWHANDPAKVEAAIDRFLARSAALRPELQSYARRARCGNVQ